MGRILIILLWKMTKIFIMLMAILTMTSFLRGSRGAGCFGGKITPSICGSNPPSWAGIDYDDNHNYNHHHNDDDHRHHDHLSRPIGGFPEDSFGVVVAVFATDLILTLSNWQYDYMYYFPPVRPPALSQSCTFHLHPGFDVWSIWWWWWWWWWWWCR